MKTNRETCCVSDQFSAPYDAVIVGAGFSGMYMLYSLRRLGLRAVVIEAADDVGGTWYWNRYPGARCDVESMEYSYSFDEDLQQEWEWKERYSAQPEILEYAGHVADRFDLRRDIRFGTRVTRAWWDGDSGSWVLETDTGENLRGHYCIMALGCLSVPRRPDFRGLDSFSGPWYHTGLWPHEPVDFSGLDVGIIGTGSSAIQSIPRIASEARHLTVFQRTPNFAVPAWNGPLDADEVRAIKKNYAAFREGARWSHSGYNCDDAVGPGLEVSDNLRKSEMERRWQIGGFTVLSTFDDVNTSMEVNRLFVDFAHDKIRRRVNDPETARLLSPTDHPFGTKRLCVEIDYFETYNRKNITLVDISDDPIGHVTPTGLVTEGGRAFDVDALVFATGFDAMTGPLLGIDIRGTEGLSLRDKWEVGPRTFLGLTVAGFPNMFTITGPQSPSVLTNMMSAIEQHVEWVTDCLAWLRRHGFDRIEATQDEEDAWVEHTIAVGDSTLYPLANSWYVGANIPGKPRVFTPYVGGFDTYRRICDRVATDGYRTFDLGRMMGDGASGGTRTPTSGWKADFESAASTSSATEA